MKEDNRHLTPAMAARPDNNQLTPAVAASTSDPRATAAATAEGTPSLLFPQIPDPISQECIGRLPLSCFPELALVSRSWRSLMRDPELFKIRSNLRTTEPVVCINVCTPADQSRWYLLIRGHNRIPAHFIPLPPTPIPTFDSACATLGHSLYVLGGFRHGFPSNSVQIFDARHGTWTTNQRMAARRQFASAGAIRGRMCIVGGHLPALEPWAEAFDPKSSQWSPVSRTPGLPSKTMLQSGSLGGCFLATDNGALLFVPEDSVPMQRVSWLLMKNYMGQNVVIDGLVYFCHFNRNICQYNPDTNQYTVVEGVNLNWEMQPGMLETSRMTNLRGLLCLVWKDGQRINCIGIQITRTSSQSVSGSIVWRESVPLPTGIASSLEHCVTLEF